MLGQKPNTLLNQRAQRKRSSLLHFGALTKRPMKTKSGPVKSLVWPGPRFGRICTLRIDRVVHPVDRDRRKTFISRLRETKGVDRLDPLVFDTCVVAGPAITEIGLTSPFAADVSSLLIPVGPD